MNRKMIQERLNTDVFSRFAAPDKYRKAVGRGDALWGERPVLEQWIPFM